jgi:hypothetical protein
MKEMKNPIVRYPSPLQPRSANEPLLRFSPLAWLKLQYFCHRGSGEIGGFGISAADDPLYIEQFVTVMQGVTAASVEFADSAVADYFDGCVDQGLAPSRFARVWCHTHPGSSAEPSTTDKQTFARVFGNCDWAVMFILARSGRSYARLWHSAGPGANAPVPVSVDWPAWPHLMEDLGALRNEWQQEFQSNIHPADHSFFGSSLPHSLRSAQEMLDEQMDLDEAFVDYFEQLELQEEVRHVYFE